MNKLSFFGVGPKIGRVLLPWLAFTIVLSCTTSQLFTFTSEKNSILINSGIVLLIVGLFFYFSAIRFLLKGLKETRLVTKGPYYLCQNPLYVAIILFVIPALAFLLNSWLILTSTLVGYILLKVFIKREYSEMEKFFGEDYLKYKTDTPEIFPFPITKWVK